MSIEFHNSDKIIYHYVCRNTNLFSVIDGEFFKNPYIGKLFNLTKKFFNQFHSNIFNVDDPSSSQIESFATTNIDEIVTDEIKTKEENLIAFMAVARIVITHDYQQYSDKYVKDLIESFVEWNNFQKSLKLAVEYQKMAKIDGLSDMRNCINQCKEYIRLGTSIKIDDDLGSDFMDPEAHKQVMPENLINSGYRTLNQWVSESEVGGFEPGTTTVLLALPNIGKSIFLGSIGANMFMNGYNVFVASLEMSAHKIMKRIGSDIFDINMKEYASVANSTERFMDVMKDFRGKVNSEAIQLGKLRIKRYSSATVDDVVATAKKIEQKEGFKFHAIVLDYFTELQNKYGLRSDDMYSYHKQNMNDFFNAGVDNQWAMITAHQVKVSSNAALEDMSLSSLSESTGIAHRPDNIIGIIQSPQLKANNQYILKNIKSRDGAFKDHKTTFTIDYSKMRLKPINDNIAPELFF